MYVDGYLDNLPPAILKLDNTPTDLILMSYRKDTNTEEFHLFKRDLTHRSITTVLLPLRPYMTTPDIVLCPDGYFHCTIYGLGPHISDYLEQAMLTWLLLGWCPT